MKTFVLIFLIGTVYCAKLDKTYLPPGASTAGGDGNILSVPVLDQTPGSGVISSRNNAFGQSSTSSSGHTQTRFTSQSHSSFGSSSHGGPQPHSSFGSSSHGGPQSHSSFGSSSNGGPQSYSSFGSSSHGQSSQNSGTGSFAYGNQGNSYSQMREQVPILKYSNENNEGQYRYQYETGNGIMAQEEGYQKDHDTQEVQGSYSYTSPEGEQITVQYIANENGFQPVGSHIPTPPPVPEAILRSIKFNEEQQARGIIDDGSYRQDSQPSNQYLAPKSSYSSDKPTNQYLAPSVSSRFSSKPSNQYLAPGSRQTYTQPSNQYLAPKTQVTPPKPNNQYLAPKSNNQYVAPKPNNQYLAPRTQSRPTNKYLAPEVTAKSGNQYSAPRQSFSEQTGYHY